MSDPRAPLVTYVKNVGGVFQGEEDFQPVYLASAVDPLLEDLAHAVTLWRAQDGPREGAAFRAAMCGLETLLARLRA